MDTTPTDHSSHRVDPDIKSLSRAELLRFLRSRATMSVPQYGDAVGISRPAAFRAAQAGLIHAIRVSPHRLVVPTKWVEAQLLLDDADDAAEPADGASPARSTGL